MHGILNKMEARNHSFLALIHSLICFMGGAQLGFVRILRAIFVRNDKKKKQF